MTSDVTPIHDFFKLKLALQQRGYSIGLARPYIPLPVADVNLGDDIQSGEIEETEEGIFYTEPSTGHRQQVFLYKKAMYLVYQGKRNKPVMHITICDAIKDFGQSQYRRANTGSVDVWDKSSGHEETVSDLPLCRFCQEKILKKRDPFNPAPLAKSSDEFARLLKEASKITEQEDSNTDLKGYLWNWQKKSEEYRTEHNYTCERCGYKASSRFDRQNIHVHHKDGNKLNNADNNLECLCVACHASVDNRHRENFSKGANKRVLDSFILEHPEAGPKQDQTGGMYPHPGRPTRKHY